MADWHAVAREIINILTSHLSKLQTYIPEETQQPIYM